MMMPHNAGVELVQELQRATQDGVEWAIQSNRESRLIDAEARLVEGWEQMLQVCVTDAPVAVPNLLRGPQAPFAARTLADLLSATVRKLVEHPGAEVRLAWRAPLLR